MKQDDNLSNVTPINISHGRRRRGEPKRYNQYGYPNAKNTLLVHQTGSRPRRTRVATAEEEVARHSRFLGGKFVNRVQQVVTP